MRGALSCSSEYGSSEHGISDEIVFSVNQFLLTDTIDDISPNPSEEAMLAPRIDLVHATTHAPADVLSSPKDIGVDIAVDTSIRIGRPRRFRMRTRPRAVRRIQSVAVGQTLLVVSRLEQRLGLGPLAVQAELLAEAARA